MTQTETVGSPWELVATGEEAAVPASPWQLTATGTTEVKALDWAEIRRALEILTPPFDGVHFSAPVSSAKRTWWKTRIAPAGDFDLMFAAIRDLDGPHSLYIGLNPIKADLILKETEDVNTEDVLRLCWLPFDCDPPKDVAGVDASAATEEKEKALELANKVHDYLSNRGWPQPLITDSGNGNLLLYKIALPNNKINRTLLRACIHHVAALFSPGRDNSIAHIDKSMHNADRVVKLPGTWAMKGPDVPDRPHRMGRIIYAPDAVGIVSLEMLQALTATTAPGASPGSAWELTASQGNKEAYARAALERECGKMACTTPHHLNNQLNASAFAMGQLVGAGLLTEAEVFNALLRALHAAGGNNPEKDESCIKRAIEDGKGQPRQIPDKPPPTAAALAAPAVSAVDKVPPGESILLWASDVAPRKVDWLWRGRLPLGKLITFAGMGGIGKTFVLCDISARVSRGLPWPDGDGTAPVGKILFLSAEDAPDDTLVPRMIECGADLSNIAFLKNEVQDYFTLGDLKTLERARLEAGADVRLVVLDPPTSFLGGVDDHKNSELRALLSPLASWAQKHALGVIFNTHLNKNASGVDAVMRVMGGIAWTTAVRIAHLFASDPDDEDRALFCPMKVNLGKKKKGLAYHILPLAEEQARVEWLGEVTITANEAISSSPKRKKRVVLATAWLAELFANQEEWPSREIFKRQKEETTLSDDALREAKEEMGMKAYQKADGEGKRAWHWYWLPAERKKWEEKQVVEEGKSPFP
jgi:hypothetical protein